MNIIKELKNKTMTEEKKKQAKNDIFAYYIGRPISYVLTVPFLKIRVKPNTVSLISIVPTIIGFLLLGFGKTITLKLLGCLCFFMWNLLDGVDGNIARYTKQFSKTGPLWDATSGYFAMIFTFLAMGTGCYYGNFTIINCNQALMITLGGVSSCFIILPRLIMHKRMTSVGEDNNTKEFKDKSEYGIIKIIALNLISVAGFMQVLMVLSVVFKVMDIFTIVYFILNTIVCFSSLLKLLK